MFKYLLKRLFRGKAVSPSPQHLLALRYWENCSNTFHASPEYYDRCETELQTSILPRIGHVERILDAGCGNGRFTLVLAGIGNSIDAYDISRELIRQARQAASSAKVTNIRFYVGDIATIEWPRSSYNLASCMGVLSTIIDEPAFLKLAQKLTNAVSPGGLLVLRETLSRLAQGELVQSDSYAIRYRNEDQYRRTFANLGMEFQYEATLIDAGPLVNRFFLCRRRSLI